MVCRLANTPHAQVTQRSQVRHRAAAPSQHGARPEDSSDDDGDVDEELRADLSPPELSDYFELWVAVAAWLSLVYGALRMTDVAYRLFGLPIAAIVVTGAPSVLVGVVYTIDVVRFDRANQQRLQSRPAGMA